METSPIPGLKRRRQEIATAKLARPFKTPFRKSRDLDIQSTSEDDLHSSDQAERIAIRPSLDTTSTAGVHDRDDRPSHEMTHVERDIQFTTAPETDRTVAPPRSIDAQFYDNTGKFRQQIKTIRGEIDLLERAIIAVQDSKDDVRLESLILKWRQASQSAADALYPTVKERIDSQGGLASLQRRRTESLLADQAEESKPSKHEPSRRGDETVAESTVEDAEDVDLPIKYFDMPAMLKILNIDHATIGYDEDAERWKS